MARVIGLTGGIASGKSTISGICERKVRLCWMPMQWPGSCRSQAVLSMLLTWLILVQLFCCLMVR